MAPDVSAFSKLVIENIEKVILGKRQAVELAVIGLLCQGHLLIEDVPGVGKTMLARSLARSLGCRFSRIQFTPDMLPSDGNHLPAITCHQCQIHPTAEISRHCLSH